MDSGAARYGAWSVGEGINPSSAISGSLPLYYLSNNPVGIPNPSQNLKTEEETPSSAGAVNAGLMAQKGQGQGQAQAQAQGQGQGQGQSQSQKNQNFQKFVENEKKLRELLLGADFQVQTFKPETEATATANVQANVAGSQPVKQLPAIRPALPKATPPSASGHGGSRVKKVKAKGEGHGGAKQPTVASSSQSTTSALKEQEVSRKRDNTALCSSSRWQHSNTAEMGSSLLEEVLTEKKLQLMQSPEVIQWLQEQQHVVRKTQLLSVPTMLPIQSCSTSDTSLPSTASATPSVPDPVYTMDQSDCLGEQSYQNTGSYDLLDIGQGQGQGEGHPEAQRQGQGHDLGQGLDLEQQNRTGIWSREASAFMSVSRVRNPDAL